MPYGPDISNAFKPADDDRNLRQVPAEAKQIGDIFLKNQKIV